MADATGLFWPGLVQVGGVGLDIEVTLMLHIGGWVLVLLFCMVFPAACPSVFHIREFRIIMYGTLVRSTRHH